MLFCVRKISWIMDRTMERTITEGKKLKIFRDRGEDSFYNFWNFQKAFARDYRRVLNDTRRSGTQIVFIRDRSTMSMACSSLRVNNVFPPVFPRVTFERHRGIRYCFVPDIPIFYHYFRYFCKLKSCAGIRWCVNRYFYSMNFHLLDARF